MEGTRRDVEQNCQGEGALIANRRDGGEFRDERKRSKPWALCAELSPVCCLLKRETERLWLRLRENRR